MLKGQDSYVQLATETCIESDLIRRETMIEIILIILGIIIVFKILKFSAKVLIILIIGILIMNFLGILPF